MTRCTSRLRRDRSREQRTAARECVTFELRGRQLEPERGLVRRDEIVGRHVTNDTRRGARHRAGEQHRQPGAGVARRQSRARAATIAAHGRPASSSAASSAASSRGTQPTCSPPASTAIAFGSCSLAGSRRSSSGRPGAAASPRAPRRGGGRAGARPPRAARAPRAPGRRARGSGRIAVDRRVAGEPDLRRRRPDTSSAPRARPARSRRRAYSDGWGAIACARDVRSRRARRPHDPCCRVPLRRPAAPPRRTRARSASQCDDCAGRSMECRQLRERLFGGSRSRRDCDAPPVDDRPH